MSAPISPAFESKNTYFEITGDLNTDKDVSLWSKTEPVADQKTAATGYVSFREPPVTDPIIHNVNWGIHDQAKLKIAVPVTDEPLEIAIDDTQVFKLPSLNDLGSDYGDGPRLVELEFYKHSPQDSQWEVKLARKKPETDKAFPERQADEAIAALRNELYIQKFAELNGLTIPSHGRSAPEATSDIPDQNERELPAEGAAEQPNHEEQETPAPAEDANPQQQQQQQPDENDSSIFVEVEQPSPQDNDQTSENSETQEYSEYSADFEEDDDTPPSNNRSNPTNTGPSRNLTSIEEEPDDSDDTSDNSSISSSSESSSESESAHHQEPGTSRERQLYPFQLSEDSDDEYYETSSSDSSYVSTSETSHPINSSDDDSSISDSNDVIFTLDYESDSDSSIDQAVLPQPIQSANQGGSEAESTKSHSNRSRDISEEPSDNTSASDHSETESPNAHLSGNLIEDEHEAGTDALPQDEEDSGSDGYETATSGGLARSESDQTFKSAYSEEMGSESDSTSDESTNSEEASDSEAASNSEELMPASSPRVLSAELENVSQDSIQNSASDEEASAHSSTDLPDGLPHQEHLAESPETEEENTLPEAGLQDNIDEHLAETNAEIQAVADNNLESGEIEQNTPTQPILSQSDEGRTNTYTTPSPTVSTRNTPSTDELIRRFGDLDTQWNGPRTVFPTNENEVEQHTPRSQIRIYRPRSTPNPAAEVQQTAVAMRQSNTAPANRPNPSTSRQTQNQDSTRSQSSIQLRPGTLTKSSALNDDKFSDQKINDIIKELREYGEELRSGSKERFKDYDGKDKFPLILEPTLTFMRKFLTNYTKPQAAEHHNPNQNAAAKSRRDFEINQAIHNTFTTILDSVYGDRRRNEEDRKRTEEQRVVQTRQAREMAQRAATRTTNPKS